MRITVGIPGSNWPNGTPINSERLPDGRTVHELEDGRRITVSKPNYRLEYLSTWIGAEEGETYSVNIAVLGFSAVQGFYEVWNFDIGKLRSYSFGKTQELVHLDSGETFTGEELEKLLPISLAEKQAGV